MANPNFEVSELAGGQLQVVDHPNLLFSALLIAIGLVPILFFAYRAVKSGGMFPLIGMLFGLPLLIGGLVVARAGSLTLDKAQDIATFHQPSWFSSKDTTVPLHTIDFATIRTMRASSYIAVVLKSGDTMTFSDSSQETGQGRAVVAINRYLGAGDH